MLRKELQAQVISYEKDRTKEHTEDSKGPWRSIGLVRTKS